ncbi:MULTISPECIES: flippase-like domain-containing protein [Methylobacterium]|jgi:putative membrane protein|uniref:Membrane protein n=3 Tax=Methylobacterium TaxID=407 RepID=A0AAE8L989_9HYPH|nr:MULTISPECIES: flippase-like domain-containing protein [Methylobacterium]KOX45117.1 membrane protein [Streptomyces purpurogeneiscleroticus]APT29862.1 membrane protein [Methylobacterium phyllosphaerae]MBA9062520.1 putative membrane protein [Methylobacterium fujisawaense]MBP28623.1 TIGR00374 family protein [Methylobacterium sp.]MDE4915544.1 flippase-like domain-containing protein [Methylobacterium sp. 092160098-2]
MKRLTTLASIAGLCTVVGLFMSSGLEDVSAAVVSAGWGAALVVLARIVAVAWAGLGWYVVFPRAAAKLADCVSLRFVREGINTLLPVATVGGDFVGARLLSKRNVPGALAGASMFVDLMTQALTQLLFTVVGLALLVLISGDGPIAHTVEGGLALAVPALGAFYLIQRRAGHRLIQGLLSRFASGREWRAFGAIDQLYDSLRRLYGNHGRFALALAVHLAGWVIGTLEVYVCLRFMGYPIDFAQALMIESLAQAVRGAAFAVPGALGAQEGGLIALCGLFDIPAEAALALSLVKRFADLGVGLPSLLLWHRIESKLRSEAPEEEEREPVPEAGRKAKRIAPPATLGPFYSYAPPRMGSRLGDGEELKKCA